MRRHRGPPTKCELVSSFPRERGSELEGAGIGEQLLGPALGKKKLTFSLAGTLLVGRTDYEHWARGSAAFRQYCTFGNSSLTTAGSLSVLWDLPAVQQSEFRLGCGSI